MYNVARHFHQIVMRLCTSGFARFSKNQKANGIRSTNKHEIEGKQKHRKRNYVMHNGMITVFD